MWNWSSQGVAYVKTIHRVTNSGERHQVPPGGRSLISWKVIEVHKVHTAYVLDPSMELDDT